MAYNEIVVAFVKEHSKLDDSFHTHFEDGEVWSSFDRIETALAAEEEFSIQFTPDELTSLTSPKSFVDIIERKLAMQ